MTGPLGLPTGDTPAGTARGDQLRAAVAHVDRGMSRYAAGGLPGGGREVTIPASHIPDWLAAAITRHHRQLAVQGYGCDHVSDGVPGPRIVYAWRPGYVLCGECSTGQLGRELMPAPGSAEDETCDGCGTHQPGGVRLGVVRLDPVTLFHYGVCEHCSTTLPT